MADSPIAGWYADPENADRLRYWDGGAWTGQTRALETAVATTVPRQGLPGLVIAGIVVGALLMIVGFVAIILHSAGESTPTPAGPSSHPSPTTPGPGPDATRTAPAVLAPEGWEVYVSRSGSIEYAYDPEWEDLQTPFLEQMMMDAADAEGSEAEMELAGIWTMDGSALTGETSLTVLATSDGTSIPGGLSLQAELFVRAQADQADSEDYEVVLSDDFMMANGYDAWRIDFTMDMYGEPVNMSLILFRHEVTLGFAYVLSYKDFEEWLPDLLVVAESIVVVKPPVSP